MLATFDHAEQHGPRVFSFFFKPERKIRYDAGQYVELTIKHPADSRGSKRWFTLSSAPDSELLSITTRISARPSSFKQELMALEPGATVRVSDPMGDFVLPKDPNLPLVFIGDGIGITPFLSIARHLKSVGHKRRVRLYYVVHAINDVLFKEELLNAGYSLNIVLTKHATGSLLHELTLVPDSLYYISGPESLTTKLTAELTVRKVAPSQIITDYFPGY